MSLYLSGCSPLEQSESHLKLIAVFLCQQHVHDASTLIDSGERIRYSPRSRPVNSSPFALTAHPSIGIECVPRDVVTSQELGSFSTTVYLLESKANEDLV